MQSAKRYLLIALSFAVALTVFAAFTPKIAHAITATLVQVVNTASNPVLTQDVNNGARQAVRLHCSAGPSVSTEPGTGYAGPNYAYCNLSSNGTDGYEVPQGKRLVIESVSAVGSFNRGAHPAYFELHGYARTSTGLVEFHDYLPLILQGPEPSADDYATGGNFTTYFDGGSVWVYLQSGDATSTGIDATVNGYLVDCGNGGCPQQP